MDKKVRIEKSSYSASWPFIMALRDSRKSKGKLLLFILSISLGIAALVGITSFRENLLLEINDQAKTLLGADISIRGSEPLPDSLFLEFSNALGDSSRESYFASMALFPRTDGTRLVQVRALEGAYPYYGDIETDPVEAASDFKTGRKALVDEKLMIQYNVELGDSVKVGQLQFEIVGKLQKIPGQTSIGATAAPVVYIPYAYLQQTGLIKKGSRINYISYFQVENPADTAGVWKSLVQTAERRGYDVDDIDEKKRETGSSFKDLTNFLRLVAFIALLLGAIGVGSSIYVYAREKTRIVATLRCLGMKSQQAITIFLIQVGLFGFIGSALGALGGVGMHLYLPAILSDFIPVDLNPSISWMSVASGFGIGIVVSILFALFSLVSLRTVSPMQAIRGIAQQRPKVDQVQIGIILVIIGFIMLLVYVQIEGVKDAAIFTGILLASVVVLGLIGKGLAWVVRKVIPQNLPYVWRQGLSNLYRPHNQTSLLITTLGLGTAFIATLFFMQNLLVGRVTIAGADERPNTILFDIQTPQKEEVRELTVNYDLPVMQEVPIVTMRLKEVNGTTKDEAYNDSTINIPDWAYNREYRVTYRDSLISSETLSDGIWTPEVKNVDDTIFISVAKGYAENLELKIGDELLFNVQGALLKTYVGSFRDIDWNRVQTNFLVVFPTGVLEKAPQFHVLITKINNSELSARYQQAVVRSYPNISIIDLELILKTLEEILGKIAFVIRFMALFSIGTGIVMLISSIILSRFQRMRENVLLRTLGASSKQLWKIIFAEYFFLGAMGAITGIFLAIVFTVLLGTFVFEFNFIPDLLQTTVIFTGVTLLTVLIGLFNSREVVRQSPLEVLRRE